MFGSLRLNSLLFIQILIILQHFLSFEKFKQTNQKSIIYGYKSPHLSSCFWEVLHDPNFLIVYATFENYFGILDLYSPFSINFKIVRYILVELWTMRNKIKLCSTSELAFMTNRSKSVLLRLFCWISIFFWKLLLPIKIINWC